MAAGLEIHDAASTGDYDSLEEYLRSGKFDVNMKDEEWNNRTALHWACAKGMPTYCCDLLFTYRIFILVLFGTTTCTTIDTTVADAIIYVSNACTLCISKTY